jgi:hypothetical protein
VAEPEHLLSVQNQLGESPIWAPEEKALLPPATASAQKSEPNSRRRVTCTASNPAFWDWWNPALQAKATALHVGKPYKKEQT